MVATSDSMSPVEYEVLFAMLQLKYRGNDDYVLHDICKEVNRTRKARNQASLSPQHVHYYLKNLATRPFIATTSLSNVTRYSILNGDYKILQSPPLCMKIGPSILVLICDRVWNCHKSASAACKIEVVNEKIAVAI